MKINNVKKLYMQLLHHVMEFQNFPTNEMKKLTLYPYSFQIYGRTTYNPLVKKF